MRMGTVAMLPGKEDEALVPVPDSFESALQAVQEMVVQGEGDDVEGGRVGELPAGRVGRGLVVGGEEVSAADRRARKGVAGVVEGDGSAGTEGVGQEALPVQGVVEDHPHHAVLVGDGGGFVGLELGVHKGGDDGRLLVVDEFRLLAAGGDEGRQEQDGGQYAGASFHDRQSRDTCSRKAAAHSGEGTSPGQ